ncbi:MAG: Cof-type HAD-IIB family hydrolase [Bacillota bacterium]|nr:Cof-type HAD-IIB family hydrolase [Bacillota bacterium]
MSIRLIALDLDDTLLNSKHQIAPPCVSAIQEARKKGVLVTLATGRMFRSAVGFAHELEIDLPLITYQGALVKHSLSEKTIYYKPLPTELSRELMYFLKEIGVYYHSYFDDQLYVEAFTEDNEKYASITGVERIKVDSLVDLLESRPALEILAVVPQKKQLSHLVDELSYRYGEHLNISRFKKRYLEILNKEATKLHALQVICRQYGIHQSEVMAVGDNYNDISMIEWAGLGVAMGNAYPEVKKIANYVTRSNDEQGVAEAIHRFVLRG